VLGGLAFVGAHLLFVLAWQELITKAFYLSAPNEVLKVALTLGVLFVVAVFLGLLRGGQASVLGSALLVGFVFLTFLYRFFLLPLGPDNTIIVDALVIVVPAGLFAFIGIYLGQRLWTRK
jgi:hypothetical protein